MSAQEQRRKLETKAIRGFIILKESSGYVGCQEGLLPVNDATPVPCTSEKIPLFWWFSRGYQSARARRRGPKDKQPIPATCWFPRATRFALDSACHSGHGVWDVSLFQCSDCVG